MTQRGEGNHEAGREYQKRTREFVEDGKVEKKAKEAREAVEDEEEGEELEEARKDTKGKADYDDV